MLNKYQNILAWVLGIGIVSFAFRSFFYPGILIGLVLCITVLFITAVFIVNDTNRPKNILGSKWVWIPLLIICVSIVFSAFVNHFTSQAIFMEAIIAATYFGTYLACRIFGEKVFKPFSVAVIIETVSLIVYSLFIYKIHNGGIAGIANYNMAIGLLVIGGVVSIFYKQWWLVTIALIGIFLTGAEEGMFAVAIMFIVVLIRRDFSAKIWLPIGVLLVIIGLGVFPFNYTKMLYATPIDDVSVLISHKHTADISTVQKIGLKADIPVNVDTPSQFKIPLDYELDGRLAFMGEAFQKWDWLGTGYQINPVDYLDYTIYNVPLVVAQEVGVLAAAAWLFVVIFCLVKTKWKYAFIAILVLSLLDNFMFCEFGVVVFAIAGVATASTRESDLIFKKV